MQQYAGLWEVKEPVVNSEAWLKLTLAGPSLNLSFGFGIHAVVPKSPFDQSEPSKAKIPPTESPKLLPG